MLTDFPVSASVNPELSAPTSVYPALSSLPMAITACGLTISTTTPINCDNEKPSHLRKTLSLLSSGFQICLGSFVSRRLCCGSLQRGKGSLGQNCSVCPCEHVTQGCALSSRVTCFLVSRELGQGGKYCASTLCCQGDELWVCWGERLCEQEEGDRVWGTKVLSSHCNRKLPSWRVRVPAEICTPWRDTQPIWETVPHANEVNFCVPCSLVSIPWLPTHIHLIYYRLPGSILFPFPVCFLFTLFSPHL